MCSPLSPIRLDSRDLLEYNATYRILICRECQYAIQKSAISSHLLRHKIYREERQRLLDLVAELELLDPEHVPLPAPGSLAIDGLPVTPGYCCTWVKCGNLCASSKRMRRHLSEVHNVSNRDFVARPVELQTFFRGTKLRYFEVVGTSSDGIADIERSASHPIGCLAQRDWEEDEPRDVCMLDATSAIRTSRLDPGSIKTTYRPSNSVSIDLETLTYFHRYTTVTSLTLPAPHQEPHFWQTNMVEQALTTKQLMGGLLCISAYHSVMLSGDILTKEAHRKQAARFASVYYQGRTELISSESSFMLLSHRAVMNKAPNRVELIMRCAIWALDGTTCNRRVDLGQMSSFSIQSLIAILRGLADPDIIRSEHEPQQVIFAQSKGILDRDPTTFLDPNGTGLALLNRLRLLPSQLSSAFGRPDDVQDVLATLSAISALVVCCDTSFKTKQAWQGMAKWLTMTTDHFNTMILANKPAALVLVAYWAVLVKHTEQCGFWFLTGAAGKVCWEVGERLDSDDSGIKSLIKDLII